MNKLENYDIEKVIFKLSLNINSVSKKPDKKAPKNYNGVEKVPQYRVCESLYGIDGLAKIIEDVIDRCIRSYNKHILEI